jgi:hypothetical protein
MTKRKGDRRQKYVINYYIIHTREKIVKGFKFFLFCIFFAGGRGYVGHSFAYVAHLYFREMSGFEPRELP